MGALEQVGLHPNAAVALRVAWRETGLPGLFRGTTSLLAREVRLVSIHNTAYTGSCSTPAECASAC